MFSPESLIDGLSATIILFFAFSQELGIFYKVKKLKIEEKSILKLYEI